MKLTDEEKACRIIEVLVSDDLCQNLEFKIAVHNDPHLSHKDIRTLNNKLTLIYELAHVANKPSCLSAHNDWVAKLNKTYIEMRKRGDIK